MNHISVANLHIDHSGASSTASQPTADEFWWRADPRDGVAEAWAWPDGKAGMRTAGAAISAGQQVCQEQNVTQN